MLAAKQRWRSGAGDENDDVCRSNDGSLMVRNSGNARYRHDSCQGQFADCTFPLFGSGYVGCTAQSVSPVSVCLSVCLLTCLPPCLSLTPPPPPPPLFGSGYVGCIAQSVSLFLSVCWTVCLPVRLPVCLSVSPPPPPVPLWLC